MAERWASVFFFFFLLFFPCFSIIAVLCKNMEAAFVDGSTVYARVCRNSTKTGVDTGMLKISTGWASPNLAQQL